MLPAAGHAGVVSGVAALEVAYFAAQRDPSPQPDVHAATEVDRPAVDASKAGIRRAVGQLRALLELRVSAAGGNPGRQEETRREFHPKAGVRNKEA